MTFAGRRPRFTKRAFQRCGVLFVTDRVLSRELLGVQALHVLGWNRFRQANVEREEPHHENTEYQHDQLPDPQGR